MQTCCNWPLIRLIILIGNSSIIYSSLTVSTHENDGKASCSVRHMDDTTGCVTLLLNTDRRGKTLERNVIETCISSSFLRSEPKIKIYYMVCPITLSQRNSALKVSLKQIVNSVKYKQVILFRNYYMFRSKRTIVRPPL